MHATKALARARELGHVLTMAQALHHDCLFHLLAREAMVVRRQAEALISVADEHRLPFWQALGRVFCGRALVESGQAARGRDELQAGSLRIARPRASFICRMRSRSGA